MPARLTDQLIGDGAGVDLSSLEGREVVPRFRRRYSVSQSELVPTISLAFTLADEYYPHQDYNVVAASKEYDLPGIVGYGAYTSRFRTKEADCGLEHAVPFIDEDSVTAAVESGKLALIHSGVDSKLIGKVYVGSESNPYAVKPIAAKVAQVLKLGEEEGDIQGVDAVDTEFACKAGSSMFKDACALVSYPLVKHKIYDGYWCRQLSSGSQRLPRRRIGLICRLWWRRIYFWKTGCYCSS